MTDTYQKLFQSLPRSPINHCYHCRKENVSVDPRSLISIAHLFKTQLRSRTSRGSRRCSSWWKHEKTQRTTKKLSGKYGHPETPVKKYKQKQQLNRWADYFEELLNRPSLVKHSAHSASRIQPSNRLQKANQRGG